MKKKRNRTRRKKHSRAVITAIVIIIILIVFGSAVWSGICSLYENSAFNDSIINDSVMGYESVIIENEKQYGIENFTLVIEAMMMQESKGQGSDPMQCSESPHNTRYPQEPNGIQDPDYSIQVGVSYFAECLSAAGCTDPSQRDLLMTAIQGYNFGNGYINWAITNYGGYTLENAELFSKKMEQQLGWSSYGDAEYAQKVMKYVDNSNNQ